MVSARRLRGGRHLFCGLVQLLSRRLRLPEDVGHFPLIDPVADVCAVMAEEIAQLPW